MSWFLFGLGAGLISGGVAAIVTKFIDQFQAYSLPIGVTVAIVVAVLVWFREFIGDCFGSLFRFFDDI